MSSPFGKLKYLVWRVIAIILWRIKYTREKLGIFFLQISCSHIEVECKQFTFFWLPFIYLKNKVIQIAYLYVTHFEFQFSTISLHSSQSIPFRLNSYHLSITVSWRDKDKTDIIPTNMAILFIHSCIVYECFRATIELSDYNRDHMSPQTKLFTMGLFIKKGCWSSL